MVNPWEDWEVLSEPLSAVIVLGLMETVGAVVVGSSL